jgi:N-acetylglutamate synthase-like GNAT family acetyltransferase
MTAALTIRPGTPQDLAAVDALLARSYPVLLKADYPPSVLVTALPLIARAQPGLVSCGTYYVVLDAAGVLRGAGGWTRADPVGGRLTPRTGHIRHVVTDHRFTRQGIGCALMARIVAEAGAGGITTLQCLSTRTAVPFYQALGFVPLGPRDIQLRPGIVFPAVEMQRSLT